MTLKMDNIFTKKINYKNEFKSALKRAMSWGLDTPPIKFSDMPLLTGECYSKVKDIVNQIASSHTHEEVCEQCFWYTSYVKDSLEEVLQSPLYYTLGYVMLNKKAIFFTHEKKLKKKINFPMSELGVLNLHAWLTTPNLEIIDLAFSSTQRDRTHTSSLVGRSDLQFYNSSNQIIEYHPQLVGEDFLKRITNFIEFGF